MPPQQDTPLGAKGVYPFSLGALLITLTAAGGVVTTVIETAWDWLGRSIFMCRGPCARQGLNLNRAVEGEQR
jgi:hypothetical protein